MVEQSDFEAGEAKSWGPVGTGKDDLQGMQKDFLQTLGNRNSKKQIIDLYF